MSENATQTAIEPAKDRLQVGPDGKVLRAKGAPYGPRPSGLSVREWRFVRNYLNNGGIGARAALDAGIGTSIGSSSVLAGRMLQRVSVRRVIDRLLDAESSPEWIAARLKRIGGADPAGLMGPDGQVVPLDQLPDELRLAISGLDVETRYEETDGVKVEIGRVIKYRFADKHAALHTLAKVRRMIDRDPPPPAGPANGATVIDLSRLSPEGIADLMLMNRREEARQSGRPVPPLCQHGEATDVIATPVP